MARPMIGNRLPGGALNRPAPRPPSPVETLLNNSVNQAGRTPTADQRASEAQRQGYRIQGDQAVKYEGKFPTFTDLNYFEPPRPPGSNLPPDLSAALLDDTHQQQGAADRQFLRNQAQIDQLNTWLGGVSGRLEGRADTITKPMDDIRGRVMGNADQDLRDVEGRGGRILSDFDRRIDGAGKDIDEAYRLGDQATAGFAQAVNNFEDRTAQDASVLAAGIRRANSTELARIRGGLNPDGTPMTSEQMADAQFRLQNDTAMQVQSAITPIFSQYNMARTQFEQQLGQLRMANAGNRLTGADLRRGMAESGAQVGLGVGDQVLRAQEGRRQAYQVAGTLAQMGAQVKQAALLQAAQLELQGYQNVAQLVQQNPESIVSWFQGLLAMYGIQAANSSGGSSSGGGGGGAPQRSRSSQQRGGPQIQNGTSGGRTRENPANAGFRPSYATSRIDFDSPAAPESQVHPRPDVPWATSPGDAWAQGPDLPPVPGGGNPTSGGGFGASSNPIYGAGSSYGTNPLLGE